MDIFDRIELLLKQNNMTQADLARATGLSTGLISQWKKRAQNPSAEKLQRIADYFQVSVDFLLGIEPEKKQPTTPEDDELAKLLEDPETREFYELIKDFSDEELEDLLKYAEFMISKREKKSKQ